MFPLAKTPRLPLLRRTALAALAALFSCGPAFAETFTWSNTASTPDSNWSTAANWINNTPPVSGNTTDILFAASPRTSPVHNLANPLTLRSLWFYDNPYTLTGNGLTFDGALAAIYNYTTTSISNSITLNSTTSYEGSGNLTFTNNSTVAGAGGFIKNGTGTVTINSFTLYSGDTHVNAGQISFGHTQALLFTTAILNTNDGLNFNGFTAVVGNIAGTGSLNLGSANISVGSNNTPQTYSGQFSATTGSLEKRGTGTWTLTGAGSNMPRFIASSGRTVLSGGSLTLTSTAGISRALTVGNATVGHVSVEAGAVLSTLAGGAGNAVVRGASTTASTVTVTGAGSRWDAWRIDIGGSTTNPGSVIADNGGVINAGDIFIGNPDGLIIQNGSVVNAARLNVNNGTTDPRPTLLLRSGGQSSAAETLFGGSNSAIDIDRATLTTGMLTSTAGNGAITIRDSIAGSALIIDGTGANATYTGSISGSGGITKNGPSTQTLAGPNSYFGPTTANAGTLILNSGSSAAYNANNTGKITLNFGDLGHSSLRVSAGGTIEYPPTVIGGFIRGSDGLHDLKVVTSFNGTTFAVDSALLPKDSLTLNNVINSGNLTIEAPIAWNGGVNTSAGRFTINTEASVSSFENNGVIAISRRSTLINSNTDLVSGGGSRITIEEQGRLELNKSELHLNGSLLVNNGLIKGMTNVNFGALAKGAGEYGEVNVTDGGKFSPGNSPGAVTTGSTTWNSGGGYIIELANALGSAGSGWDIWNIAGILDISPSSTSNGRFTISLASLAGESSGPAANFDPSRDYSWTILHADKITGFDPSEIALDTSGFKNNFAAGHFFLASTATDLSINFTAVPEPTAMALLTAASALLTIRQRRRSRL
jgi:fibronectin-binding autotransporter adhesin